MFLVEGNSCRLFEIVAKPLFQQPVKFRNFHLWGIGDRLSDMDIELRPGGVSRMHIDGNRHSIYQGRIASLQDPRQPFFKGEILAGDRKSTRLNSSHVATSYAVFNFKKK